MISSGEVRSAATIALSEGIKTRKSWGLALLTRVWRVSDGFMMLVVVIGELESHSSDACSGEEQRKEKEVFAAPWSSQSSA